ncbi:EAL domain-containing protein [Modestobacter sp. I12A-02628]|nr:EAL domain-containing protein [Goekera deserti]
MDLAGDVGLAALRPGQGIEELVQLADLALAAAAEAGPGVVRQATASLLAARDRRDLLLRDLVGARARGELGVVYQPIVSVAEHRITGAEALVRWTHPLLGEIPPEEFLPIAERAGVLADLERWVLAEAATAAASLPDVGGPLRMGVDVSAGHVATGMLVGHVSAALARSGLAPERLVVEVSEAAVTADGDRLRTEFDALRLMGVRVGLDGFGAHTSGLSHLTRLPLDLLKIDRSFLTRIDRDATTRALCESTIRVSQALGFDVVAVGVESPSELAVLGQLGCGSAQGRLLARPMALSALHALVEERAGLLWPGLVGRS